MHPPFHQYSIGFLFGQTKQWLQVVSFVAIMGKRFEVRKMLKYHCLVLDHDDTVVQTERTMGYPYFRDYIERIRPGQTLSFPEYVRDCNNMNFADMCRIRWQFTEEELQEEYTGWKAYSRIHTPAVCSGMERIIRRQK